MVILRALDQYVTSYQQMAILRAHAQYGGNQGSIQCESIAYYIVPSPTLQPIASRPHCCFNIAYAIPSPPNDCTMPATSYCLFYFCHWVFTFVCIIFVCMFVPSPTPQPIASRHHCPWRQHQHNPRPDNLRKTWNLSCFLVSLFLPFCCTLGVSPFVWIVCPLGVILILAYKLIANLSLLSLWIEFFI